MTPRVDTIFDAALELAIDQQRAFIDLACGGDEALRAERRYDPSITE